MKRYKIFIQIRKISVYRGRFLHHSIIIYFDIAKGVVKTSPPFTLVQINNSLDKGDLWNIRLPDKYHFFLSISQNDSRLMLKSMKSISQFLV